MWPALLLVLLHACCSLGAVVEDSSVVLERPEVECSAHEMLVRARWRNEQDSCQYSPQVVLRTSGAFRGKLFVKGYHDTYGCLEDYAYKYAYDHDKRLYSLRVPFDRCGTTRTRSVTPPAPADTE